MDKLLIAKIAHEVLDGKWDNGNARKALLKLSGYDYNAVQAEVNRILESRKQKSKKTIVISISPKCRCRCRGCKVKLRIKERN
jgi:hypothetical protein